ncbi:MAG: flagellar motor protein PomA, partial [OM182 bacterium]
MDIATILGLIGAFGLIISAIGFDQLGAFIDIPSVNIVVAGSLMVTLLRSSLGEFLGAVKVFGKTFKNKLEKPEVLIMQLVEFATIARKDGMIALEGQDIANPFMAKAVSMLVDGSD